MTVSGETLKLVSKYLKTKKPKQVKYAVLYRQPWSKFFPDYCGKKIYRLALVPVERITQ